MYHIVYRTTRISTGEYYIGVHSTKRLEDGYVGSGNRIKRIIKKHGRQDLQRDILHFCKTRLHALALETQLVSREILSDPLCMNLTPGGKGMASAKRSYAHTPETRAKLRLLKQHVSKTTRQRISESKRGHQHSERTKQKIRQARLGTKQLPSSIEKVRQARKGTILSEETKQRISNSKKGIPSKLRGVSQPTLRCPHCGKEGGRTPMRRWHFDQCKHRIISSVQQS